MDLGNPLLWQAALALSAGGAAWGAAKTALNGTKERVRKVEKALDVHIQVTTHRDTEVISRLAALEGKIDVMLTRYARTHNDA